jgi:hypothetical protein
MTIAQLPSNDVSRAPAGRDSESDRRSRISFRQPVTTAGFIDAAWWPRTHDLTLELPPLMDVLWTAGREINRITYNLVGWDRAPRRMTIEGRTVRLGGFTSSDPMTVRLSDPRGRERVDILVVAPGTDDATAARLFEIASRAGGRERAGEIMALAEASAAADEWASRRLTLPGLGTTRLDESVEPDVACAVCAHHLADHDAIGLRYCRATQAQVLSRGCICR